MNEYSLFFDGAWKAGISSFGFTLFLDNAQIDFGYGSTFGDKHDAEAFALCQGLDCFIRRIDRPSATLHIYGDSQFIINTAYKNSIIRSKLKQIEQMTSGIKISWIPREMNSRANNLAKRLRSLQ